MGERRYSFLVVEDEIPILKILNDILKLSPHIGAIYSADNGENALEIYKSNNVDVIVTDILMPKLTGLELIKKIKEINSEAHIIVISAYGNIEYLREAIRNGAYDYILKPFTVDEILFSVNRVIEKLKFIEERKNYVSSLEKAVRETSRKLENSFFDSLRAILNALEARDYRISRHCHDVSIYSEKLSRKLCLSKDKIEMISIGALLHDIGKIAVPDSILLKEGSLTEEEENILRKHPVIGRNIVLPVLKENSVVLNIIFYHHERFDGSGYPEGLRGENIPIEARIVSLANWYVARFGDKKENERVSDQIVEALLSESKKRFDPDIVKVFIKLLE